MQILVNGANVGTDLQNVLFQTTPGGVSFLASKMGHLKEISATTQNTKVIITPVIYNGLRIHRNIYHDLMGEMTFTRFNGDITNLIWNIMLNFRNTGAETYFSLYTSIWNSALPVPSLDEYQFTQLVFDEHSLGRFNGTSEVDVTLPWRCQTLTISGTSQNVLTGGPSLGG